MTRAPLAYVATPYTCYAHGTVAAWQAACRLAGKLIKAGTNCYSPIAHSHPIARYGGLDPLDHDLWMPLDQAMMERCDVLIVAHLDGWECSKGIAIEVAFFEKAGKPIFDLDPQTLTMTRRRPIEAG
jgi:nucleoside 2-deoxyribosyltransferase